MTTLTTPDQPLIAMGIARSLPYGEAKQRWKHSDGSKKKLPEMHMFMFGRISIGEGKGVRSCDDQAFEWLPFLCSISNFARCYLGQSADKSQVKVKLTQTLALPPFFFLPLITLWSDFKYLFCCLPWSQGHKLAIDLFYVCAFSVCLCLCRGWVHACSCVLLLLYFCL